MKVAIVYSKAETSLNKLKIALVYDRVNKWGGAERVLLALHEMFPNAPLYTSVYDPKGAPWAKVFPAIKTSFLQYFPFAKSNHEFLAPLMPFAFKSLDLTGYHLVISVTSEFAKNIRISRNALHICYCLTPTRYLWSHYDEYFKGASFKAITNPIIKFLRGLDLEAAKKPDVMIAISQEVKRRIKKYYHRDSQLVFPPVSLNDAVIHSTVSKQEKYYLVVSRLDFGYKKVDLVIKAFNKLEYPLLIVGSGREEKRLKSMSKSKKTKFVGRVSEGKLSEYYKNAKALVMPQEEDFGIVAVEAQSFGVPVIAYKKGGVLDTVIDKKTGILFDEQSVPSLEAAISRFEKLKFNKGDMLKNAKRFSFRHFKQNFAKIITHELKRRKL